jgi:molybdenum cofactor synthesis domain-containing protein
MPLVPLAEARAHVLGRVHRLPARGVPLGEALGLVVADAVHSDEVVPPFANTAMDGFAVRAADTTGASAEHPVRLEVIGTLHAGAATDLTVDPGQALRIMTGAPMPPGADAVVMVERTAPATGGVAGGPVDEAIDVFVDVDPGTHVRGAGEDVRRGDEVVAAGTQLTPAAVGVLASVGVTEVAAVPRPRVGVVSTGDELVQGGAALLPGQIRDSNRPMLLASVAAAGFTPVDLGHAPDDADAITEAFRRGADTCDALLSSGGVSMGDADLVKVVLDDLGDFRWMQIAIKPAKPFAFGVLTRTAVGGGGVGGGGVGGGGGAGSVPVFGLPGNPVSSAVSFALLAAPALRAMAGRAVVDPPTVRAVVDRPLARRPDGKDHYARVVCRYDHDDGCYHVRSAGGQGSHQLAALAAADALAVLPDGPTVEPGGTVEVILLG